MKFSHLVACAIGAMMFSGTAAKAEDREVTSNVRCESNGNGRNECRVDGLIQSARMAQQQSFAPCQYGYSWGFIDGGIWVGGGCRADFEITSIVEEQTVDPVKLDRRAKRLQRQNKKLREQLAQARAVPVALKRISACVDSASERAGQPATLREIFAATPQKGGKWTIVGTLAFGDKQNRQTGTFLCQTERNQVLNVQYPL